MTKRKTLKKQKTSLESMTIIKSKKSSKLKEHDPSRFFKNHEQVAEALLRSLEDNDVEAYLKILNTYLYINKQLPRFMRFLGK